MAQELADVFKKIRHNYINSRHGFFLRQQYVTSQLKVTSFADKPNVR